MCIARDIYLWDIRRINYTTLEAKVGIPGYKALRKLIRKAGCKVHISQKNGYPFWFSKMKKRKMLIMGAFFSFSLLLVLSSFILVIEVTGNEVVSEEDIINALGNSGLQIGVNRYFLDLREIENDLLIHIDELSWVGIEINGIVAKIKVVEKTPPPMKIEKNIPCNVIARKSGVIEKVIAKNGDAVIKKGDIVAEGDLLITGTIEREGLEGPQYVHAYGEVYAKTYYETSETIDLIKKVKLKTGAKYTRRIFKVGELELSLSKGDHPYEIYILEKKIQRPFTWRNKGLPVEIITEEIYEAIEIEEKLDVEIEKRLLHERLLEELLQEIPRELEILNSNVEFMVKDDTLQCIVMIEVLEDIGEQKILDIAKQRILEFEED